MVEPNQYVTQYIGLHHSGNTRQAAKILVACSGGSGSLELVGETMMSFAAIRLLKDYCLTSAHFLNSADIEV